MVYHWHLGVSLSRLLSVHRLLCHVCVCMCTYTHLCICACVICMCVCMCMPVCTCICVHVCVCECVSCGLGKDRCLRSESTAPLLSLPPYPPPEPAKITSAFGISQRPFCSEGYWLLVWIEDIGSAGPLPGDESRLPCEHSVTCLVSQVPWGRGRGSVIHKVPSCVDSQFGSSALIRSVSHVFLVTHILAWLPRSDSEKLEYFFKQPLKLNVSSFEDACFRNSVIFRRRKLYVFQSELLGLLPGLHYFFKILFILSMLGLRCYAGFPPVVASGGYPLVAV